MPSNSIKISEVDVPKEEAKKEEKPKKDEAKEIKPAEKDEKKGKQATSEDRLLDLVEKLTGAVEASQKENNALKDRISSLQDMVEGIADKGRLMNWELKQQAKDNRAKTFSLSSLYGKIVVGWTPLKQNLVFKNGLGVWQEKQTTEVIYEDNSREEVDYRKWQADRQKVEMTCEKEELVDNTRILHLISPEGKKFVVDVKFTNS